MITREGCSNLNNKQTDMAVTLMGTDEYNMYAWQILGIMEGMVTKEILI